jgi:SAM-dependent methyltransferase
VTSGKPNSAAPSVSADAFDAFYYQNCCGKPYLRDPHWLRFFGGIADRIVADIAPQRVMDAGCAMGILVEALRERGVDAYGIDLSPYAIEQVHDSAKAFCRIGSIAEDFGGDYSLIVSIEVVEHMPAREAEAAIANMCAHTTDVLFSSSPHDYREPTHVNVHPPEHWAEEFARHGFFRDVDYDASFIQPWAVRFRKRTEPVHRLVRDYERRYWTFFSESHDVRTFSTEIQRKVIEAETRAAEAETRRADAENVAADARRTYEETNARLTQALDTIHHMERSFFWKARRAWVAVRRTFGGKD